MSLVGMVLLKVVFFALSSVMLIWVANWGITVVADRGRDMIATNPIRGKIQIAVGVCLLPPSAYPEFWLGSWFKNSSHEGPCFISVNPTINKTYPSPKIANHRLAVLFDIQ